MLVLPATLTAREATDTARLLLQALRSEADAEIVVDAATLVRFDSSALAVLLSCRRAALGWNKPFALRNTPSKLRALARLYGVESLLMSASAIGAETPASTPASGPAVG